MKTILIFLSLLLAVSGFSAPLTNTITFDWLDFGYQVDSVTNKPVKITPLEYSTVGSFFIVKTPRIYTNTFAGQCVVTNMQAGSYRVELATALGSITTFTSTIPATATGGTNYEATQFVTNYATNSGSTRSYSIIVSDLRYPSTAGSNIVFYTNAGRVTIAGTVVTGTSPTVASNYLAVTKLDATNGTAYALTVSGLLNSTNMDAKISAASNTVHTALIATNTILAGNINSLNTAANNNAGNVTSISNRVIQAEVTNAVQQTALAGLTNSIANLNTNYIATTNGVSQNLTNLGAMYSDRLVVTNLVVGTNANKVQITNGTIIASGNITASSATIWGNSLASSSHVDAQRYTSFNQGSGRGGSMTMNVAEIGVIQMTDVIQTNFNRLAFGLINSNFPALKRNAASLEVTDAVGNSRATNNFIVPGVVISTNGFILPASTPFTAPASLSWQGSHLWSDGTNLCVVLQNSAGTRTTNKVTLTAWP